MCSAFVVIAGVGRKDPAKIGLAEDDDVIEDSRRIEPISLSAWTSSHYLSRAPLTMEETDDDR
jgi:hypothetical protein